MIKINSEQSTFTLFETLCKTNGMKKNILFSPYSLQQAFSLLAANTKDSRVLKELAPYVSEKMLDESLLNTKSGTLMLLSDEFKPYRAYKEKGTVELFSSPENGKQKVIDFQRKLLGEVLMYPQPKKSDGLGLYAALHYMAEWLHPFNKLDTRPRTFYLEDGQEIQTETMSTKFSTAYGKITKDYEVAALPGKNQSITYFVKPKTEKETILRQLEDICSHDDELHYTIIFQMPKISIKSEVSLQSILKPLKMACLAQEEFTLDNVLDPEQARTKLNAIQQAVRLNLDEERAEVKAFTMIKLEPITCCMLTPPKPLIIKMDRPYFIIIKDKTPDGTTRIVCTAWISNP